MQALRCILFIATVLLLFTAVSALAETHEKTSQTEKFVDLDGDGIRDNAQDTDNNGIPDFDHQEKSDVSPELAGLVSFGTSGESESSVLPDISKDQFKLRKFSCRAHTGCRGEFGAGNFGPNLGITGSVSGGCAGGLCF
jgi:hypothetical protein